MSPEPQQTTEHLTPTARELSTEPDQSAAHATRVPADYDPYATRLPSPEEDAAPFVASATGRELPMIPGHCDLVEIGRGGMGVVYRATQTSLNRLVAIKMILAGQHASREVLERFRTEAEAVARLQHPNIVQIHQIDYYHTAAGTLCPYMILEFADHGSLERKLAGKPMDPRNAAELAEILARAMAVAHGEGIVHRDLKPANILLQAADRSGVRSAVTQSALKRAIAKVEAAVDLPESTGPVDRSFRFAGVIPKISDFGLAKQDGSDLTASGAVMGTPSYMSPEQASGQRDLGPPTDIYALGAILYECLIGRPPFLGATPIGTLDLVRHQEPVPPRRLQPAVPRDIDTICLKCLQKKPKDRYPSTQALADDLRRFLQGEPISIRPPTRFERALRWSRKHPLRLSLFGAALLLAIAVGVILLQQQRMAQQEEVKTALRRGMDGMVETFEFANNVDLRSAPARVELFKKLKKNYQGLLEREGLFDQVTRGEGYLRLGIMGKLANDNEQAMKEFEQARSLLTAGLQKSPERVDARRALARANKELGILAMENASYQEAGDAFAQAERLCTELRDADPDSLFDLDALAEVKHQRGELASSQGKNTEAVRLYAEAIKLRTELLELATQRHDPTAHQHRQGLARDYGYLGDTQLRLLLTGDAEKSYRSSLTLRQQQVDEQPTDRFARFQLARGHENMGNLCASQDRGEESVQGFRSARRLLLELYEENPGYKEYQADLARVDNRLALLLADQGQPAEARQLLEDARRLLRPLVRKDPAAVQQRAMLAWALAQEGRHAEQDKRVALLTEAEGIVAELETCRESPDDGYVGAMICLLRAQELDADRSALKEKARLRLGAALKRGFSYVPQLRRDPLFKELLNDPALQNALAQRSAS